MELKFIGGAWRVVGERSRERSSGAGEAEPVIIISASGRADAGRRDQSDAARKNFGGADATG